MQLLIILHCYVNALTLHGTDHYSGLTIMKARVVVTAQSKVAVSWAGVCVELSSTQKGRKGREGNKIACNFFDRI